MTIWMVIAAFAYGAVAGVAMFRTHLEYRANRARVRSSQDSLGLMLGTAACVVWPLAVLFILIAFQIKTLDKKRNQHYG